jgi:hypothetical protein
MVGLGRFELPTSRLSGVRSNQLSYRPLVSLAAIFGRKKEPHFHVRVRFDGGRARGPCSFGGFYFQPAIYLFGLPLLQRSGELK